MTSGVCKAPCKDQWDAIAFGVEDMHVVGAVENLWAEDMHLFMRILRCEGVSKDVDHMGVGGVSRDSECWSMFVFQAVIVSWQVGGDVQGVWKLMHVIVHQNQDSSAGISAWGARASMNLACSGHRQKGFVLSYEAHRRIQQYRVPFLRTEMRTRGGLRLTLGHRLNTRVQAC